VLVLEEDSEIQRVTIKMLASAQIDAVGAQSLSRALEPETLAGGFDLVMISSDLCRSPGLTELLNRFPAARFLVTTTGHTVDLPSGSASAFRGLLHKPYTVEHLVETVQAAIRGEYPPPGRPWA
jgi:DNA-binding response OmpR family regulator